MTSDKALADKARQIIGHQDWSICPEPSAYVREPRVAMALIRKLGDEQCIDICQADGQWYVNTEDKEGASVCRCHESLERAIVEATVEALSE